jgi:uncharacterized membrane protein
MTKHNEIDEQIRAALADVPHTELAGPFEEAGVIEQFRSTFRGRNRWLSWIVLFWAFAFFVLAVVSAVKFFQAEDVEQQVFFGAGFIVCMIANAMLKTWQWMQMDKAVILREIKRLELQVARLTAQLSSKDEG